MAYCDDTAIITYAPQAAGQEEDFTRYRANAETVINSHLRGTYSVPMTPPIDPLIMDIAARMTAGRYLTARYSQNASEENAYGRGLVKSAMDDLLEVVGNPNMIATAPTDTEGVETGGILVTDDDPVFDMGEPEGW